MAGKVINSSFLLLGKFDESGQVIASKTATSHMRKPLYASLNRTTLTELIF